MRASLGLRLSILLIVGSALSGCGGKDAPSPPDAPRRSAAEPNRAPAAADAGGASALHDRLAKATAHNGSLEAELAARRADIAALEEAKASLELELGIALEELIRSRANLKNVQSRAFAVSRIAELRVELESFESPKDPPLRDRLEQAESFLERADRTLDEDNWGGAAFLAERAGELVRQAKTIAEIRKREPSGLVPIVPRRMVRVVSPANLRRGPSTDAERLTTVEAGVELEAKGRLGDWFQVTLAEGEVAWLHRSLVE